MVIKAPGLLVHAYISMFRSVAILNLQNLQIQGWFETSFTEGAEMGEGFCQRSTLKLLLANAS